MQLSEHSYYRLYRAEEEQLTRDLERRRIAFERGERRPSLLHRVLARFRVTGSNQAQQRTVSDAGGTMGVCVQAEPARH
jgi:hypothetical protein